MEKVALIVFLQDRLAPTLNPVVVKNLEMAKECLILSYHKRGAVKFVDSESRAAALLEGEAIANIIIVDYFSQVDHL